MTTNEKALPMVEAHRGWPWRLRLIGFLVTAGLLPVTIAIAYEWATEFPQRPSETPGRYLKARGTVETEVACKVLGLAAGSLLFSVAIRTKPTWSFLVWAPMYLLLEIMAIVWISLAWALSVGGRYL